MQCRRKELVRHVGRGAVFTCWRTHAILINIELLKFFLLPIFLKVLVQVYPVGAHVAFRHSWTPRRGGFSSRYGMLGRYILTPEPRVADACILVAIVKSQTITAPTEFFQSLLLHLLVSPPKLRASEMKWESETTENRRHEQVSFLSDLHKKLTHRDLKRHFGKVPCQRGSE